MSGTHPAGDTPMSAAQHSHLKLLSEEANLPFDDSLTQAQASRRIEELQRITGHNGPEISVAGEEDPGASLGQPGMRDAMQGEARQAEKKDVERAKEQATAALQNVREGHGGDPDAAGSGRQE